MNIAMERTLGLLPGIQEICMARDTGAFHQHANNAIGAGRVMAPLEARQLVC